MSDVQYAIDIATEMPSGEVTLSQLDDLTAKLVGGGKSSDVFQQAIQQSAAALDAARAAAKLTASALAEAETEYSRLERAAVQASKAAEKAAARNGGIVPDDMAAAALAASNAVNAHAIALRKAEDAAKGAASAEAKLATQLGNVRKLASHVDKRLGDNASRLANLRGALGDVGGPAGELGERLLKPAQAFTDLSETMGKSRAAMVVTGVGALSLAAIMAVLTVGVIAAVSAFTIFIMKAGAAGQAEDRAREAAEALDPALRKLRGTIEGVATETNLNGEALRKLATDLKGAGVAASELPAALRAAAMAEAALGAGGASKFIADIKAGKLAVADFTTDVQAKFGGIVARQMLTLEAQTARLNRVFTGMSKSLDLSSSGKAMALLADWFDESTYSGQQMKKIFEEVFQPIIDGAETAAQVVEAFAIGILIGLTRMYIALKPTIKGIKDFFGFEDQTIGEVFGKIAVLGEWAGVALGGMLVVGGALLVFLGFAVVAVGLLAAGLVALVVGIGWLIGKLVDLGVWIFKAFMGAFDAAIDWLAAVDWSSMGGQIIKGLINGIKAAGVGLPGVIAGVINGGIRAAKKALGIASPSKVFAEIGSFTGEGFTRGVQAENDNAQAAVTELVAPPAPADIVAPAPPDVSYEVPGRDLASLGPMSRAEPRKPTLGGAVKTAAKSSTTSLPPMRFEGPFNFYGVKDAEHATDMFEEMLTRVLSGDADALNGGPADGDDGEAA